MKDAHRLGMIVIAPALFKSSWRTGARCKVPGKVPGAYVQISLMQSSTDQLHLCMRHFLTCTPHTLASFGPTSKHKSRIVLASAEQTTARIWARLHHISRPSSLTPSRFRFGLVSRLRELLATTGQADLSLMLLKYGRAG
jgi:hypothetical protein